MADDQEKKLPPFTPLFDALFEHKEGKRYSGVSLLVRRNIMSYIARKFAMGWKDLSISQVSEGLDLTRKTVAKHWASLAKDLPKHKAYVWKAFPHLNADDLVDYVCTSYTHTRKRVRKHVSTSFTHHVWKASTDHVRKASTDMCGSRPHHEKSESNEEKRTEKRTVEAPVPSPLPPDSPSPSIGETSKKAEGLSVTSRNDPLPSEDSERPVSPNEPGQSEDKAVVTVQGRAESIPGIDEARPAERRPDLDKINRLFPNEPPAVSLADLAKQLRREGRLKG